MIDRDNALRLLRESRDGSRIWTDDGATVARLARAARVTVTFATVDLRRLETIYRTVDGKEGDSAEIL